MVDDASQADALMVAASDALVAGGFADAAAGIMQQRRLHWMSSWSWGSVWHNGDHVCKGEYTPWGTPWNNPTPNPTPYMQRDSNPQSLDPRARACRCLPAQTRRLTVRISRCRYPTPFPTDFPTGNPTDFPTTEPTQYAQLS